MARGRSALHAILTSIEGPTKVYFQPPASVHMEYPCIVYRRDDKWQTHADNKPYAGMTAYQVTVIDRDPDSEIPGRVAALERCSFDRFYTADDLNHDVYTLFF